MSVCSTEELPLTPSVTWERAKVCVQDSMLELSFDTSTEAMFYLMTLSIHFIYGHLASGRKEGNVLSNNDLNTFYLRLYGVDTQIAREETCCHHMGYSFLLVARVVLYASPEWSFTICVMPYHRK